MANGMGMGTESTAWRVDRTLEQQIEGATSTAEIVEALKNAALQQELVTLDPHSGDPLPTERAFNNPDARTLTRVLTINGSRYELHGLDENELNSAELALHHRLQQQPAESEQRRAANGRFVEEDPVISEQVSTWLQRRGIDPADLQEVAGRGYVARWSSASDAFRRQHPEYEPNEENMRLVGDKLIELGLEDSPSLESLERAYREVADSLVAGPETELAERLANATDSAEVARISSQMFGTSGQLFNRL